jgi:hypothetical protein
MKLVVDDDFDTMRKRYCFLVDHEEMMEFAFGIDPKAFEGLGAIPSTLLLLFRIYVSQTQGVVDADLRVPMHELQQSLRADPQQGQGQIASGLPGMLPPGEEDIIDAEFTDEPRDEAEEEP